MEERVAADRSLASLEFSDLVVDGGAAAGAAAPVVLAGENAAGLEVGERGVKAIVVGRFGPAGLRLLESFTLRPEDRAGESADFGGGSPILEQGNDVGHRRARRVVAAGDLD